MKENALKILTLTYNRDDFQPLSLTYDQLELFLPSLTRSGLRSLVTYLKHQGLVEVERVLDATYVRITNQGRNHLNAYFPAFDFHLNYPAANKMKWAILVFKTAPKGDKQFRYLRSLLIKMKAITLSRGVYVFPFSFPAAVLSECQTRYSQSVMIGEVSQWVVGDDRSLVVEHFQLLDLIQSYSGISKDIIRLIERKKTYRELNHQEKKLLSSLFDRLYANLQDDYGLIQLFFPDIPRVESLLLQIQSLLKGI